MSRRGFRRRAVCRRLNTSTATTATTPKARDKWTIENAGRPFGRCSELRPGKGVDNVPTAFAGLGVSTGRQQLVWSSPLPTEKKIRKKKVWGARIPSLLSFFFPLSRDLPPGNQTLDAACSPLQCAAARGGYEKRVCRICLMSSRHMTRPSPALDSLRCKLVHFPRRATRQFFPPFLVIPSSSLPQPAWTPSSFLAGRPNLPRLAIEARRGGRTPAAAGGSRARITVGSSSRS